MTVTNCQTLWLCVVSLVVLRNFVDLLQGPVTDPDVLHVVRVTWSRDPPHVTLIDLQTGQVGGQSERTLPMTPRPLCLSGSAAACTT